MLIRYDNPAVMVDRRTAGTFTSHQGSMGKNGAGLDPMAAAATAAATVETGR